MSLDLAAEQLRSLLVAVNNEQATDPRILSTRATVRARDAVLARYQPLFSRRHLPSLSEDEFRQFLQFRNNHHWAGLQRMGPAICRDMSRLREALLILTDEDEPIRSRLDRLVPASGQAFVPRLGRAVLTPILLIHDPGRYGVLNKVSKGALQAVDLWPDFDGSTTFGQRYEAVNEVLLSLAHEVSTDLWTLDALLWSVGDAEEPEAVEADTSAVASEPPLQGAEPSAKFGLERHLHEFLRDNWDHTDLGREWRLYEEEGDPEAGYEYRCSVGRIDLLAKHRTESRWLIVELKRGQSGDQTIGQVLRYMGWVRQHLAGAGDRVEGLVIAHDVDDGIRYAVSNVPTVRVQRYEVEFRLVPVP